MKRFIIMYVYISVLNPHFFWRIRIQAKILRIRILGYLGGKGKKYFFSFFHVSDDSEQLSKNFEQKMFKFFRLQMA